VPDREDADDLVQGCLDQAWRRIDQWHPSQDLRAWLFSIIHNLHANTVTRFGLSRAKPTVEGYRYPGALERHSAAYQGGVEHGLSQLAPEHREVLLLVCIEEMTYQQVAAVLGVPAGAVVARLHRAREQLRPWLTREQRPSLRRVK
jgi:RNA polymerase sigma-70 factor (ECF subfamily)